MNRRTFLKAISWLIPAAMLSPKLIPEVFKEKVPLDIYNSTQGSPSAILASPGFSEMLDNRLKGGYI